MVETIRKIVVGCTVPCKHNLKGQCDLPQMSKELLLADEKCVDHEAELRRSAALSMIKNKIRGSGRKSNFYFN